MYHYQVLAAEQQGGQAAPAVEEGEQQYEERWDRGWIWGRVRVSVLSLSIKVGEYVIAME